MLMFELLKLILSKRGFTCRVMMPGQVIAYPVKGKRQLMVIVDLDE